MEKEACLNCRSLSYVISRTWFEKGIKQMTCGDCDKRSNGWRDADGNQITYKEAPGIWHSLGKPINSARELSEHAKKHNLVQTGEIHGKPC